MTKSILRGCLIGMILALCLAPVVTWANAMGDYLYSAGSGFVIEAVAVLWVRWVHKRNRWYAGAMSAVQALALVCGIELAGQSTALKAWFVVGYALGSVVAVGNDRSKPNRD